MAAPVFTTRILSHPGDWVHARKFQDHLRQSVPGQRWELMNGTEPVSIQSGDKAFYIVLVSSGLTSSPGFLDQFRRLVQFLHSDQLVFALVGSDFDDALFRLHRPVYFDNWELTADRQAIGEINRRLWEFLDSTRQYRQLQLHPITAALLQRVDALPFRTRTKSLLRRQNIVHLGDLVQLTEAELLRIQDFGRAALNDVKAILADSDLRLGMTLDRWPPENIEAMLDELSTAAAVTRLEQARGGATFEPAGKRFAMVTAGDEDDYIAALKPMNRQMQQALLEKARRFAALAGRLDNQPGWSGIGQVATDLVGLLDRPADEIADVLGSLYANGLELISFAEFDQRLATGTDSYALPLDPEMRRPLTDLVRTLAPWLRAFPSVREMDDEASNFLVRVSELQPTIEVVSAASEHRLISEEDAGLLRGLCEASARGEFQGGKAGGRAKRTTINLVIAVAANTALSMVSGAVAGVWGTTSPLVIQGAQFLTRAEREIGALIGELPDLQYTIGTFVREIAEHPLRVPQEPQEVPERPAGARGKRRRAP